MDMCRMTDGLVELLLFIFMDRNIRAMLSVCLVCVVVDPYAAAEVPAVNTLTDYHLIKVFGVVRKTIEDLEIQLTQTNIHLVSYSVHLLSVSPTFSVQIS